MRRVAIAGASGYTGVELLRFLVQHPAVRLVALTAETHAGQPISQVFPNLKGFVDLTCRPLDAAALAAEAEFVFLALPHKASMTVGADLVERGVRVLDLSADFRLKDPAAYSTWYGFDHAAPTLLREAVYGLPELHREAIATARLVAVPGCYPTSAILGLSPLLAHGLVEIGHDRHRFDFRRLGRREEAGASHALLRGQREPEGLRRGQASAHAGDRAGACPAWPGVR